MSTLQSIAAKAETVRGRVLIGSIVLAVVVGGYGLLLYRVPQLLLAPKGETVRAQFFDTALLRPGNDVRVHGVRVGRVQEVQLDRGARGATVEMRIYDDGLPLFADARAAIRWRTLLGGSFYVDLDRGSPSAGELATGVIARDRTLTQVELEDLARVVRGGAREGLRTTLTEMPQVLGDPRYPAETFEALADASPTIDRGVGAFRGERTGDLQRMIDGVGRTAQALNEPTEGLRKLIAGGATTFAATAARSDAIRQSIARAARVQRPVRATLASLNGTLRRADPLIAELDDAAPRLEPAARRLRPVLDDADRLLDDVAPLMRKLRPAAKQLESAAQSGAPLLDQLATPLRRLDRAVLPAFAKRSPESKRATYEMVGSTFASLAGALSRFDAESSFAALYAQVTDRSIDTLPCRGYAANPTDPRLADCRALGRHLQKIFDPKAGR